MKYCKMHKTLSVLLLLVPALLFSFKTKAENETGIEKNIENIENIEETISKYSLSDSDTAQKRKRRGKKPLKYNEKGEIIKTGYNLGPLPVIAYDADKGFQLGAVLNLFDFGNGDTYPNPRQQWYFETSFFTKGSQLYTISYDNKFSIPGVRFSTTLTISNDKAMDFYGFNGYASFYDYERVKLGEKSKDYYQFTPFYKVNRLALLFKGDFIGNIWNKKLFWEAGYHLSWFDEGPIIKSKINKNKKEENKYPDDAPTLYDFYRKWGIIGEKEAGGGFNSSVRLGLLFDTRDKEGAPTKGIWAEGHLTLAPKWLGTKIPYYKYSVTFRHYIALIKNDILTFAYRLNYEGTLGKQAPYYILPYITIMGASYDRDGMGGFRTVRGLMRNRVVGLDMATYNAEFRWRFVKFKLWKQNISFAFNFFSDGTMVTKKYDMSFQKDECDFKSPEEYQTAKKEYEEYIGKGVSKELPHITAGAGLRFIMNENFIVCFEYGMPVTKYRRQDGNGAFYVNVGYLF